MILASRSFSRSQREDAFDRPLRADRHEDRRFDITMGGVEDAGTRACLGAGCLKLESEHRLYCMGHMHGRK